MNKKGFSILFRQNARFLLVGLLSTCVHLLGFVILVESISISALFANMIAFSCAVFVSFIGHFAWTFRDRTRNPRIRNVRGQLIRFILTALLGAFLNSAIAWYVVDHRGLTYLMALVPMALTVPFVTFIISRNWVFSFSNYKYYP